MIRKFSTLGRVGGAAVIALVLGACTGPEYEKRRIALGGWTQERMLADGWIKAPPEHVVSTYCYRTLAAPDCYAEPLAGQSLRLTVPIPVPAPPPAPARDE